MLLTTTKTGSLDYWKICAVSLALLAPFFIYFPTLRSIVAIWDTSGTFAHGYAVLPISLWLIWRRRDTLPLESAAPWWPGLLLLAGCGLAWLFADLAAVQVVRQYAFVAMIPLIVLTMVGPTLARSMTFPLLFLLLAVPFGEVFIGPLVNFTADFTVAALRLTGIPVLRNGAHFDIPSGSWSVLEACSGIRYLISSFTLGCLYAYLTYRSAWRRLAFILLAIVTPIIANGMRAYMIVMIADLSDMRLAVGVDHLIYGWLFFGLVMFVMFVIGSFWREDDAAPETAHVSPAPKRRASGAAAAQLLPVALATLACLAVWPLYSSYITHSVSNPKQAKLDGFHSSWQKAPPFTDWKPHFLPANAQLYRFFKQEDQVVGLSVLYYRNQNPGTKLISSSNQMVVAEKNPVWIETATRARQESLSGRTLKMRETQVRAKSGQFLVWSWYWVDGRFTANDYLAKLLQAKETLLMQGDDGAAIAVFAPFARDPDEARSAMRRFLTGNLVPLKATLAGNRDD